MATSAYIAIPNADGVWAHVYCHYDGYPEHMLPALEHHSPEAILAAREIRGLDASEIEPFEKPRRPEYLDQPTRPLGISYLYAWDALTGRFILAS